MRNLLQDFRYAIRVLRKAPGFALAALVVLALGIGANTAIFSVVNAVLLRPLPFGDSERLVRLWHVPPAKSFPGTKFFAVSAANFIDWKQQNHVFDGAAIYGGKGFILTGSGEPESLNAGRVASDFFSVLRVRPILGRTFLPEEDQPGREQEVVLSYGFWQSHFGGDRNVVGRTMTLNGQSYTVVGVMGPSFLLPSWAKMWTPMAWTDRERAVRGEHSLMAIARLKPGVTVQQAQAEMDTISRRLEQHYPEDDRGWGAVVLPLREDMVSDVKPALLVLLGAVAFVLLIACANVANLFLAKMLSRRKEIAIRAALGATRRRLLQQSVSETVVLALAGGGLGVLLANYAIDLIKKLLTSSLPGGVEIGLDTGMLVFTLLMSLLTGVLAGILPAWRLANTDVHEALKQGLGRTGSEAGGGRMRRVLVIAEVALSLVLLVGAGLMLRTLWALRQVDPGFDARQVLTMQLSVPPQKYATPLLDSAALDETLRRIRSLPGVQAAAAIDSLPLQGGSTQPIAIAGRPALPMADQPEVAVRVISPSYLRTMRVPVLRGRDISDADSPSSHGVVLISEAMAHRFWPNQDPIGQHLTLTFMPSILREVVGIVGDVKQDALNVTEPPATLYFPAAQLTAPSMADWRSFGFSLVVRTATDPGVMAPSVIHAIHEFDAGEPVIRVETLVDIVSESLAQQRFTMLLLSGFAALAVLLAAVGIYSVLAYMVRRRMREIGIRMALGAQVGDVLRMVVLDGIRPTLVGVAIGLAGALALGRVLKHMVYGVGTQDAETLACVSLLLMAVGLAASLVPAYRASRVEPVAILRDE